MLRPGCAKPQCRSCLRTFFSFAHLARHNKLYAGKCTNLPQSARRVHVKPLPPLQPVRLSPELKILPAPGQRVAPSEPAPAADSPDWVWFQWIEDNNLSRSAIDVLLRILNNFPAPSYKTLGQYIRYHDLVAFDKKDGWKVAEVCAVQQATGAHNLGRSLRWWSAR
jgi:hypothetical protein